MKITLENKRTEGKANVSLSTEIDGHFGTIFNATASHDHTTSDFEKRNSIYNVRNKDGKLIAITWNAELKGAK